MTVCTIYCEPRLPFNAFTPLAVMLTLRGDRSAIERSKSSGISTITSTSPRSSAASEAP